MSKLILDIPRILITGTGSGCGKTTIIKLINGLLSDKEFYEFLDDLGYKASQFQIIARHEAAKNIDLNLGGYYLWDMQMFVQDFIRRQLVKNGLDIELN